MSDPRLLVFAFGILASAIVVIGNVRRHYAGHREWLKTWPQRDSFVTFAVGVLVGGWAAVWPLWISGHISTD